MCRNFNVCLKPMKIEDIFFAKDRESGLYSIRPEELIQSELQRRIIEVGKLAEDCSKKSTKAGYDAAGMAVGVVPVDIIFKLLAGQHYRNRTLSYEEVTTIVDGLQKQLLTQVKVARDGGDLLKTWDALERRLGLHNQEFITSWETHVRQASQGDMYSESNAHPHWELTNGLIRICHLVSRDEVIFTEHDASLDEGLFYDTHNGDINDAARYKRFLIQEGFRFISNSDSCVAPALKRYIYEHLQYNELAGALYRIAYTDPDFSNEGTATVDSNGYIGNYFVGYDWAEQTLDIIIDRSHIIFLKDGQRVQDFIQRGFLRDDKRSLASEKMADLLILANRMVQIDAQNVTIAATLVARILEYSNKKNKFVFQSFSPIGKPNYGLLGGGTYTTVRGGSEEGGEEGGEIIFHIPKPYDARNYGRITFLSASEENALKEQVALLDPIALTEGQVKLAEPKMLEITTLPNIRATAYITEGVMPIFDVLPGEIAEVSPDGHVRLFDIYRGNEIPLAPLDEYGMIHNRIMDNLTQKDRRAERLAALKVFRVEYSNLDGQPIPCPYNKYGEEIIVIQPLALRRNSDKLFTKTNDGIIQLRTGEEGIGLTMGADNDAVRHERIRRLTHVITGAAGTSYLINTIAGNIARKLCLNTLPMIHLDGFTGSDTIPAYVGEGTLFLANSNSGGTSDTIRLTHELASLPAVIARVEAEIQRRDSGLPEVANAAKCLAEIRSILDSGDPFQDWPSHLRDFLVSRIPWIYVITNIEASALGNIGSGLDLLIRSAAGVGITNLPEEESVGSTFAAMASLQWQIALHTYIGEIRGDISSKYANQIYNELSRLPDVVQHIVGDSLLIEEIKRMANELVGGNFDFVYTDYLDGVPEEQAHKAAEMIQEMFAGWHFFQFQHGKYAHMKRRTRHTLGSILAHNAPPPSWPLFNARALKSPYEIGPRVATSLFIVHGSDLEALQAIPEYAPDYILTYPADSIVLYPFQVIIISHLISYFWGLKKKEVGQKIRDWNEPFVDFLLSIPRLARDIPELLRSHVEEHARQVLHEFMEMCETTHYFDRVEGRRKTALINGLSLLASKGDSYSHESSYTTGGLLYSNIEMIGLHESRYSSRELDNTVYLSLLKDLAVEFSNGEQAKRLADHFLVDEMGRTVSHKVNVDRPQGRTREVHEYDYLIEYEGLGTFYDVEPVHPPKIAKAKKGWL